MKTHIFLFLLLINTQKHLFCSASSILVDWSPYVVANAQAYVIDYVPPVGFPPAGTSLASNARRALLNGTISATEYTIYLSAITSDGSRTNVTELTFYSSPDPPILDTIETTDHEATISYFPPQGNNLSYYIEYYPEGHQEYSNVLETKASVFRLRGLDSGTQFRIKIKSIFRNVRSEKSIEASFKTQGEPNYDYSSSGSGEAFSVRTLPPDFDLATTATPPDYEDYSKEYPNSEDNSAEVQTVGVVTSTSQTFSTSTPHVPVVLVQQTTSTSASSTTSSTTSTTTTRATTRPITTTPTTTTTTTQRVTSIATSASIKIDQVQSGFKTTDLTEVPKSSDVFTEKTTKKPIAEEIDTGDYDNGENFVLIPVEDMVQEYGDPTYIEMSQDDNKIRLDWDVPEGTLCDAYFLNYTILTLSRPKSFSVATTDEFTLLKMFPEHTLDLRVFCMLAGSMSKTWWAHRIAYLAKPKPIENFRVDSTYTDDFYVSSVTLDWKWPKHDFSIYKIVVTYRVGKAEEKELEVLEQGPVIVEKLEPAQLYVFTVRNESIELPLVSKSVEISQITPPLISSTLYPGQISSSAININFGESDPEQGRFDHYELTFTGNNKNITRRIEMDQERSLTFTKLIPGKTYEFSLYTVYKGIRSRPVEEAITTYPLKVKQLFPVVGKDYVVLYWDIENFADSDCRFRVSYNADKIPPVSVELRGASRHRFSNLQAEVYYTFTILVIMGSGKAAAESESEMVTVHIPKGRLLPTVQRQGSRELSVEWENDFNVFNSLNGEIKNYAVIVSDNIESNDDNYELKSWFEVKDEEEKWGSYRASPSDYFPFSNGNQKAVFTIGTDDCLRRSLDEPYCNGILRSNTSYMIKVRGYTDTNVAVESDWGAIDGVIQEEEEEDKGGKRLPCYMYLNGCSGKKTKSTASVLSVTSSIIVPILLLLRLL